MGADKKSMRQRLGRFVHRFLWLVTGENVPRPVFRVFSYPAMALAIAVLAFVLGLAGAFFSTEIRHSTKLVITRRGIGFDAWVFSFWCASALWAILFYIRLIAETDERRHLERAIERCPNPRVVRTYRDFFGRFLSALESGAGYSNDAAGLDALEKSIKGALSELLSFARSYADPVPNAPRGCNIMLIGKAADLPKTVLERIRFLPSEVDVNLLQAVLYLAPGLIVSSTEVPHVKPIVLPVPSKLTGKFGSTRVLPGAPYALLTGQLSVHPDTRKMSVEEGFKGQDAEVQAELAQYFDRGGEGEGVRSFASVRVGDGGNPIAVLNLDYSEVDLLGDEAYYGTFLAFLSPVLFLLRNPLDAYGKMLRSLGRLT